MSVLALAISMMIMGCLVPGILFNGFSRGHKISSDAMVQVSLIARALTNPEPDPDPDPISESVSEISLATKKNPDVARQVIESLLQPPIERNARGSIVYVPVSLLTQRPAVLVDIDSEVSERLQSATPQSFELLLLINEYGDVDHVHIVSMTGLTSIQLSEIRQLFQSLRFLPGQLEGVAMASALRIRVQLHP